MKPILVHCHIYYPEMWPELKSCILNINPHPFQLYVTMVEEHQNIIKDIKSTFDNPHIEILENRGFDIGPFIHTINKIDLDDYSYIVKLHTKRDMNLNEPLFRNKEGSNWRETLLSFIKTPETFNKYLAAFEKNPNIGMQADHTVIVHHDFYGKLEQTGVKQWLQRHSFTYQKYAFVAGTMFIARAKIFKDIQNLHLTLADFPDPKGEHKTQLAHIMERLFGYFVYKNGFIVRDSLIPPETEQKYHKKEYIKMKSIYPIVRFFYQKKITKSGKVIIKICKIPVYRKKV